MKVRTFDGTKKYGNEYALYHLWASAMVLFNEGKGLVQQNQRSSYSKSKGLVQQNHRFGSTKAKVWFSKTKGLVQQNQRFGSTKAKVWFNKSAALVENRQKYFVGLNNIVTFADVILN